MRRLERALNNTGYKTFNITYPSTQMPLEELVEWLHVRLSEQGMDLYPVVHVVGYSMGCLLIRAYLNRYPLEGLGRVVMLAPPNLGSEIADAIKDWWIYKKLYGPAGQQLITQQDALKALFGEVHYELGILAGTRSIDPLMSRFLPKPHDGKVSVASTKLAGMKEHKMVRVSHTFFPQHPSVIANTIRFLSDGVFDSP